MSNTHAISLKRSTALLAALTFVAMLTVVNLSSFFSKASAAQLEDRAITLSSTLSGTETGDNVAGSPTNGSDAVHTITFTPTTTSVTTRVEYCTNAIGTCAAPTGVDFTSDTPVLGGGTSGVAAPLAATNAYTLTFGATTGGAPATLELTGVTNPTYNASPTNPDDNTFFVRITTLDGSSDVVDEGTVASAVTEGIVITARVAETLGFSTAAYDGANAWPGESTNCAPLTGSGALTLGDPTEGTLSIAQAYDAYSGFRIYTNAAIGAAVQYEGSTLTKGVDTINAMGGTATASTVASEQFGLAVNFTDPDSVLDSAGVDSDHLTGARTDNAGTEGRLAIGTEYVGGNTNLGSGAWAFVVDTPTTIGTSGGVGVPGYVTCDTYAVQYIGNISPTTPAGTYTTTVVYSAVPTY